MASSFSLDSINSRLDELHATEQSTEAEKKEMRDLLQNAGTTKEKSKIIGLLSFLNTRLISIQKERLQLIDLIKIQMEKGRFLIYLMFPFTFYLIYFGQKENIGSPSKKMRKSLPPPTSGFKWSFDTLNAYSITFQDIYSVDELLFDQAPTISGTCFLHTFR
jgi:hypothetical protein